MKYALIAALLLAACSAANLESELELVASTKETKVWRFKATDGMGGKVACFLAESRSNSYASSPVSLFCK